MEKKYYIIIIIFLIIVIGSLIYTQHYNSEKQVTLGGTTFILPSGYHEGNSTSNKINITNDFNSMILFNYSGNSTKKYITQYKHDKEKDNTSISISNFTVNNDTVYKAEVVGSKNIVHYWFLKNNKTYSIYTWDANKNMDNVVIELINSAK